MDEETGSQVDERLKDVNRDHEYERREEREEHEEEDDNEEDEEEGDEQQPDEAGQGCSSSSPTALGRNRRVRQKNRYFLDFHCIDLTKGVRSKEDFSFSQPANIGPTTRRSTEDQEVSVETKYCRKCSTRTAHDCDSGGCQVCLYKKIVSSYKRQSQKRTYSRKAVDKSKQHEGDQQSSNEHDGNVLQAPAKEKKSHKQKKRHRVDNNPPPTSNNQPAAAAAAVAVADFKPPASISHRIDKPIISEPQPSELVKSSSVPHPIVKPPSELQTEDVKPTVRLRIDDWTPDEVADYIMSRGFVDEAELFKTESVDGISLLLMQRADFTYGLKMKLGPALKIYDQVCKLKKEYFTAASQGLLASNGSYGQCDKSQISS